MRPLVELLQDPKILAIIAAHLVAGYYLMKALSKYEPLFTKKEVDTLFSKLPGDGSQAPTDYGSDKGIKVRLSRTHVVGLGQLDVIIVGGGLSGLTMTSFLAQHGYKTLCLTAGSVAGGSVSVAEVKGYEFPVGWSRYEIGVAGKKMVDYVAGGGIRWGKVGDDVVFVGDKRWSIPSNSDDCVSYFAENFPEEKDGIVGFFDKVKKTGRLLKWWHLVKTLNGEKSRDMGMKLFKAYSGENWTEDKTAKSVVEGLVANPTLRALLGYRLGVGASEVAWARLAQEWMDNFKPHLYPVGGPTVLAMHMCEVVRKSKGLVLTESEVKSLKFDDNEDMGVHKEGKKRSGRCWGVNVNGHELYALRIVWAAGLRNLWKVTESKAWGKGDFARKLTHWGGEAIGTGAEAKAKDAGKDEEEDGNEPIVVEIGKDGVDLDYVKGIEREEDASGASSRRDPYGLAPAPATLVLYLGFNLPPSNLPFTNSNVTLLLSDDVEGDLRRYDRKWSESGIPRVELYSPTMCDESYEDRWPGRTTVVIKCKTDYSIWAGFKRDKNLSSNLEYIKVKEFFENKLMKALEMVYPGVRGNLQMKQLKTPVDHDDLHEVTTGSGDGMGHSVERYGELSDFFGPTFTDVLGLFVSGKDVNGGGFEGGVWSGMVTSFAMSKKRVKEFFWDFIKQ